MKLGILEKEIEFLGEKKYITKAYKNGGNTVRKKPIKLNLNTIMDVFKKFNITFI